MAITGWSDSNYLRRVALVGTQPFLVVCWFNTPSSTNFRTMFAEGTITDGANYHQLQLDNATLAIIESYDGTGDGVSTGGTAANNTWSVLAGAFISNTSRSVWLNNITREDNATSVNVTGATHTIIGRGAPDGATFPATGGLAEISIWSGTGMTQANMDALVLKLYNGGAASAGGNPLLITAESSQPWSGKLVAYWPLTDTGTMTTDAFGSNTLTTNGSLSNFASHPTIEAASGGGTMSTYKLRWSVR